MVAKKEITLGRLAEELGGELIGDEKIVVSNICDIHEARAGDLAFVTRKKFESHLEKTKASCVVVPPEIKKANLPVIRCKNPNLAFKKAVTVLSLKHITHPQNVHKTAVVGENVKLGKNVAIGAQAVIEDGVQIGARSIIYSHSYVGHSVKIGEDCIIYPNVTIRENAKIGNRVIIHPGSVIGSDGFGYEMTQKGHEKIPHIGSVIIDDDVEIGACVTVDRAKFSNTRIGRGTKIDNLVQIAHNVTIGENCIIVAQCGISGSAKIGNNVIMGGQVGVADHMEIGDNVMIAAKGGIMQDVPSNTIMWGLPSRPIKTAKKIYAVFEKLPQIYERLKAIEKKLGEKKS